MNQHEITVFQITRQFVDSVRKPMIDRYLSMQEIPEHKFLLNTLLEKYRSEQEKADKEELRNFEQYLKGDKYGSLKVSCLNHAYHYKIIIIDILQGKV